MKAIVEWLLYAASWRVFMESSAGWSATKNAAIDIIQEYAEAS